MKRITILSAIVAVAIACGWTAQATAGQRTLKGWVSHRQAKTYPWHGEYYDVAWGTPVALVVPPTAESQWHLGWGVGGDRVTPIQHQYERNYPGPAAYNRSWFKGTPRWPSDTDQFGDYYIRGPW